MAYTNRGNAYSKLGQHQRALQDYNDAVRLDPQSAFSHANRALSYTVLGKDIEAQNDFDRAVELGFDGRAALEQNIERIKDQR